MKDIQLYGIDPERNLKEVRVDENGFVRVGSTMAVARTTNPTALADGTFSPLIADSVGRLIITPYNMRGLIATANVVLTRGLETTLLAGDANAFNDLIWVSGAFVTTGATVAPGRFVSIRDGTGGAVVLRVLAGDAGGDTGRVLSLPVPFPQSVKGAAWTAQLNNPAADLSDDVMSVEALFVKNS